MMKLTSQTLRKIITAVTLTHGHEIGCESCFDQMEAFAEAELAGKKPGKALPLVQEHLNKCGECRQEYEALLKALEVITAA